MWIGCKHTLTSSPDGSVINLHPCGVDERDKPPLRVTRIESGTTEGYPEQPPDEDSPKDKSK
jgi:hypothetical protein